MIQGRACWGRDKLRDKLRERKLREMESGRWKEGEKKERDVERE